MDVLFLIGRILYGGFFVVLGASYIKNHARLSALAEVKRVPYPTAAVMACSILSIFGGLGIVTGRHTVYALGAIILVLVLVSFRFNDYWNADDPQEIAVEMAQFMRNMALVGATVMMYSILLPWSYSF
jgi:putative oxidoreductase